jgi:hypothetical protein
MAFDVSAIAKGFRKDKRTETKIATILAALVRTGFATTQDGGQTFRARRVAYSVACLVRDMP